MTHCVLAFFSFRMTTFKKTLCQPLAWTSRSEPSTAMTKFASCRFGTQLVRSDSRLSHPVTIRAPTESLSLTISQIATPSTLSTPGWVRSKNTHLKATSQESWSETRVTWRTNARSHSKKDKRWQIITLSDSWRPRPRSARMLTRPFKWWPVRLSQTWRPPPSQGELRRRPLEEALLSSVLASSSKKRKRVAAELMWHCNFYVK